MIYLNPTATWHEPLPFTQKDYENFKFKFNALKEVNKNYSQCYQDLFVLAAHNGKRNGTFLEIGAGAPFYGNNTALLSEFGWSGISLEWDEELCNDWKAVRPNDNIININAFEFNYYAECKKISKDNHIDYLQLDIDPAVNTYNLLELMPFDKITFGVITYEHDWYIETSEYRDLSRKFLTDKGYVLIVANISPDDDSPYEDWWIHKDYINSLNENIKIDINKHVLFAKDYMIEKPNLSTLK